ncbi:type II toxin-antitoxin system VapC family toxin [Nodosilinea sp. P-1105]|uniref:type II toxin-antitoxin system VapC family toxin n=1 Tax=Nodosilinea sp. P-1105 TaxID=2546229 RepID=UPI00146C6BB3|nr:type II toxin-antitoxin system VapC family toxin [Nodosilinea sp. P-1105]NMF81954.1 type II toxin-antitoxin system VapC family toxin [Nodosilinea sp. P-1105]
MYLLDTNICIALNQEHPAVLAQFEHQGAECYIPTLVLAELYKGVYCSKRIAQNLAKLEALLSVLAVVPFDNAAAEDFGKIQGELRRMGKPTGEIDALIAAVARSRRDVVVTDNTRHFENISNLQLENWLLS